MIIETKKFKDVNRAPYNPRVELKPGMPEYEKLAKSINKFNQVLPMVFNQRSGVLVGGHQTMTVFENNGKDESQMSIVDLDDSDEKALNIALNKISGLWDTAQLSELLGELSAIPDFDIELTGFDIDEVASLNPAEVVEDDFDVGDALADIDEPVTKRGDIILLGKHRLMCGDSTDAMDVERLMDGKKTDMVFTDIPYNISQKSNGLRKLDYGEWDKGEGSDIGIKSFETTIQFNTGAYYFFCGDLQLSEMLFELEQKKYLTRTFVWIKPNPTVINGDKIWLPGVELCAYGKPTGGIHNAHCIRGIYEGTSPTQREHPNQKPIQLPAMCINTSSNTGQIILDMFLGSGSTLIAAEQTNRICYGMELDEKYCDVIISRWETFTGLTAIRPKQ